MRLGQIEEARALAPVVTHLLSAADTTPAIVIQYVSALGTGSSSASVQVQDGTGLRFKVDGATPAGNDAIGNSSGWILFATYTNMGQVLDQINGKIAWRAYLVAALRGDLATHLLTAASQQADGDNGLTLYFDSSRADLCGVAVSGEKFVNNGVNGHVKDADDECENYLLYSKVNVASDGSLKFYTASQSANTQLGDTIAISTDTDAEVGEAEVSAEYLRATRGQRLVVRVEATTAGQACTPTQFHVLSKTAVLRNDRIVDEDNY